MQSFRIVAALALWTSAFANTTFKPDDVSILGDLDYGQTSDPVECTSKTPYCALLFSGLGGDSIEIVVKSGDRGASVALADGALNELASGTTRLTFKLPNHGPDAEAYYIVFRDPDGKPGKWVVQLSRTAKA